MNINLTNTTVLLVIGQSFNWKKFLLHLSREIVTRGESYIKRPGSGNAIPRNQTRALINGYLTSVNNWYTKNGLNMVLSVAEMGKIEFASKESRSSEIDEDDAEYVQTTLFSATQWAQDSALYNEFCLEAEDYCRYVIARYLNVIEAGVPRTAYTLRRRQAKDLHDYINGVIDENTIEFFEQIRLVMKAGKLEFLLDTYF